MGKYVLLDYTKDDGNPAIAVGTKEAMEKKLEELKKTQHWSEDPGRYEIMPYECFIIAFG